MRVRIPRIAVVVLFGLSLVAVNSALSQDERKASAPGAGGPPDMAEMMKKWQASASPNEHHKQLEPFVGQWKTTTKAWFGPPGAEPTVTTGKATVEWMLGRRYIAEQHASALKMPGADGSMTEMPFEGHGVTGYDNVKRMYTFGWIDSMSTQLLTGLGSYDPESKTFVSFGQADDGMTGQYGKTMKYVHRVIDNDKNVFEIHDVHQGPNGRKVLEVTYERVK